MISIDSVIKYTQTLNVLYVEDNEATREITTMLFEDFFNTVIVADNGQDGFDKFISNDIDLIITDMNMPKFTGLQMIEKIRERDKDIPILVFSACDKANLLAENSKYEIDGYLNKPMEMEQFLSTIKKATQKLSIESR